MAKQCECGEVAQTIAKQLGNRALVMIGAKNLLSGPRYLQLKLGRNAGKWTHLKISLNDLDLYDFTFYRVRGLAVKQERHVFNVYCDVMLETIRNETGMETNL